MFESFESATVVASKCLENSRRHVYQIFMVDSVLNDDVDITITRIQRFKIVRKRDEYSNTRKRYLNKA